MGQDGPDGIGGVWIDEDQAVVARESEPSQVRTLDLQPDDAPAKHSLQRLDHLADLAAWREPGDLDVAARNTAMAFHATNHQILNLQIGECVRVDPSLG